MIAKLGTRSATRNEKINCRSASFQLHAKVMFHQDHLRRGCLCGLAALFTSGTLTASAATGISSSLAQISAASLPSARVFGLPMQFEKNAGQAEFTLMVGCARVEGQMII